MHIRYKRIYHMLKTYGFSPAKAVELLTDAKRGDMYAWHFIRCAYQHVRAF